jgi:starvation-inducible DNA-binding protein
MAESDLVSAADWLVTNMNDGLNWYAQGKAGSGLKPKTVAEAKRIVQSKKISREKAKRMAAWFARHEPDMSAPAAKRGHPDYPSPGVVAAALWGGGSKTDNARARAWAERVASGSTKKDLGEGVMLNERQKAMYAAYKQIASEFGKFDQTEGANGAHYAPPDKNPFKDAGLMCKNCVFWDAANGGQCEIVAGVIPGEAVCKLWIISESDLAKSESVQKTATPELVDGLKALLSDTVTVYFTAHGYHWNAKGELFSQYHELFGEIYSDLYESVDPIAESLLKLSVDAPFRLGDFVALRSIGDAGLVSADETGVQDDPDLMTEDLLNRLNVLLAETTRMFNVASAANEQGIANFLAGRAEMLQKWTWQLRASGVEVVEDVEDPNVNTPEDMSMKSIAKSVNAPWKITFPISKAEQRADGFYILGEASGPEIDATDERMAPDAIQRFAEQISQNALTNPLPYRDAHAQDGVLRDLGSIVRAWITDKMHLGVEVKLDEANPAAMYLFAQLQKGKQFGMSVAGAVRSYKDEFMPDLGKNIRTYYDVTLNEISNTTRPAWTPSFGTVLHKAIDDVPAEEVETVVAPEAEAVVAEPEAPVIETSEPAEAPLEEAVVSEGEVEKDSNPEHETPCECGECGAEVVVPEVEVEADVEKVGRKISAETASRLLALHEEMTAALKEFGLLSEEVEDETAKSVSNADESNLEEVAIEPEKETVVDETEELKRALAEASARIVELENSPAVSAPPLIERGETTQDDVMANLASISPSERLRLGLALAHRK